MCLKYLPVAIINIQLINKQMLQSDVTSIS